MNDGYAKELEPCAPLPSERIEALKKLNEEGIFTYLFMFPIFPEFSEIDKTIDGVRDFVDEIYFENLNIRANNRKTILEFVSKHKPELMGLYEGLVKNRSYWDSVEEDILKKCESEGVKFRLFFHHGK